MQDFACHLEEHMTTARPAQSSNCQSSCTNSLEACSWNWRMRSSVVGTVTIALKSLEHRDCLLHTPRANGYRRSVCDSVLPCWKQVSQDAMRRYEVSLWRFSFCRAQSPPCLRGAQSAPHFSSLRQCFVDLPEVEIPSRRKSSTKRASFRRYIFKFMQSALALMFLRTY